MKPQEKEYEGKYGNEHTLPNKFTIKHLCNKFMKTGSSVDAQESRRQTITSSVPEHDLLCTVT
jgi:hypothetical protein